MDLNLQCSDAHETKVETMLDFFFVNRWKRNLNKSPRLIDYIFPYVLLILLGIITMLLMQGWHNTWREGLQMVCL